MKNTLLLCLIAMRVAAEPMTAMVWGGGVTRADAEASLAGFEARQKMWDGALALSAGYPQIVESKAIAGMKPGFVVVLLGYCAEADSASAIELLKQFDTSVYSRPVESGAASCPKLSPGFTRVAARSVKTKEGELLGIFLERTGIPRSLRLLLQLRARTGALIDSAAVSIDQLRADHESCDLEIAASGITLTFDCPIPQGCPVVGTEIGERRFLIKNGKIDSRYVTISRVTPPCAGE